MMEVPHLNIFIREDSLVDGARKILSDFRPHWDTSITEFKVFTDGITNKLLGCFHPNHTSDVILIRVYGNKTDLLIDRKAETKNIKILHSAGLAPQLYATFDNGLVYEYVPGRVLTPMSCRLENIFTLVARRLADIHGVNANGYLKEAALKKHIKKFLSLVPEKFSDKGKEMRAKDLLPKKLELEKEYSFLEQHVFNSDNPIVFCHNDLLLGNVIYNSDSNFVTFIDYEYADYNYQAYDIANHFNEYAGVENVDYSLFPDEIYQKKWLRVYLERYKSNMNSSKEVDVSKEEIDNLYSEIAKFTLASHYLWGAWCMVQAEYSSIEFDFVNYAFVRFQEYYNRKRKIFSC